MVKTEAATILKEQHEKIKAAKTQAIDHDLAFNLQMQETLAASRAQHTYSPPSPSNESLLFTEANDFDYTSLILEDIARIDQENQDRDYIEQEMKRLKLDLDRQIHSQNFAKEIMNIPDGDWTKNGDNIKKPYALGASSSKVVFDSICGDSVRVYASEMGTSLNNEVASVCEEVEPVSVAKKTKKRKRENKRVEQGTIVNRDAAETSLAGASGEKSTKRVRFAMKNNVVWKPHCPLPPLDLRLPPSATPRGSALKKGIPAGPVRELPAQIRTTAKKVKPDTRRGVKTIKTLKKKSSP